MLNNRSGGEDVGRIYLDLDRWRFLMDRIMNILVPQNVVLSELHSSLDQTMPPKSCIFTLRKVYPGRGQKDPDGVAEL
jgi:hypothetical protein